MSHGVGIRDYVRYGFAVGRVRVLQTRLLRSSHFERLLDAADFEEQRRILSETPYGVYLEGARTADDVNRALDRARDDLLRTFLDSANLPETVVAYFRIDEDYGDLRGLLKAEALGLPPAGLLGGSGSVRIEALVTGRLPAALARALRAIRARASGDDDELRLDLIDHAVDAELHRAVAALADRSRSDYLREMAGLSADLANVKVLVRLRAKGLPVAQAVRLFVEGGSLRQDRLVALYRLSVEEAAQRLTAAGVFRGVDPEALFDPARFDVVADRVVARHLARARLVAAGLEPIVAYVLSRRTEIATVRTLLIGNLGGVSRDLLRTRLRDVA